MRRQEGGGGCGARGRDNVIPHSGGAGAPPGTTRGPCQELADGGPPDLAVRGQSAARRRKKTPHMERREASAP
jgi:hypothetical protein